MFGDGKLILCQDSSGTGNLWILVSEAMKSVVYGRVLDVLDSEFGYLGVQSLQYWEIVSTDWGQMYIFTQETSECILGHPWILEGCWVRTIP